jgi:N-acetyl-anhydromuramoyl-L-alanine amidase
LEQRVIRTIRDHLLEGATVVSSPNCDFRPDGSDLSLIVIHGISLPPDEFGGAFIEQLFCNKLDPNEHPYFAEICHLRVSSHLLIRRDGSVIQFVPFDKRAWHAGVSCYQGRSHCNDYSIGIELEGADHIPYELIQYEKLIESIAALLNHYPKLKQENVAGHCDIAPGRKTDPGVTFDWEFLRSGIAT